MSQEAVKIAHSSKKVVQEQKAIEKTTDKEVLPHKISESTKPIAQGQILTAKDAKKESHSMQAPKKEIKDVQKNQMTHKDLSVVKDATDSKDEKHTIQQHQQKIHQNETHQQIKITHVQTKNNKEGSEPKQQLHTKQKQHQVESKDQSQKKQAKHLQQSKLNQKKKLQEQHVETNEIKENKKDNVEHKKQIEEHKKEIVGNQKETVQHKKETVQHKKETVLHQQKITEHKKQQVLQEKKQNKKKQQQIIGMLKKQQMNKQKQQQKTEIVKQKKSHYQLAQQYFINYQNTKAKPSLLELKAFSFICAHEISQFLINSFFSASKEHTIQTFVNWVANYYQKESENIASSLAKAHKNLDKRLIEFLKQIQVDQKQETVQSNIQLGDGKGKTNLTFGLKINKNNKQKHKFVLRIQIKTKRAKQLHGQIQKFSQKFTQFNLQFSINQKALFISVYCLAIQLYYKQFISFLETKFQKLPQFCVQNTLTIKAPFKNAQQKFINWISEGFAYVFKIKGNSQTIKYGIDGLFGDIFPSLKAIKKGQINVKLNSIDHVQKFFMKLGISEMVYSSPTIKNVIAQILSIYSSSDLKLIQLIIEAACLQNIAQNDKIGVSLSWNIHMLNAYFTFSTEGISQLKKLLHK